MGFTERIKRVCEKAFPEQYTQFALRFSWTSRKEDIVDIYLRTRDSPSRMQFINMLLAETGAPGSGQFIFFEFGCNIGINLEILHTRLGDHGFGYYGCDINRHCIDYAKREYPWMHAYCASDKTIVRHMRRLPPKIDVFFSKSSMGYLTEANLDKLLKRFAPRVDTIVIGDSMERMDEETSDMVEYYYRHPFRKLLSQNGYEITHFEPMREERRLTNTGIIVAKKK